MRITKERIERLSVLIVKSLLDDGFIILTGENRNHLREQVALVMTEDMEREVKLDEEVRDIISSHNKDMDRDNVNYSKMFLMIKSRLARERGITL